MKAGLVFPRSKGIPSDASHLLFTWISPVGAAVVSLCSALQLSIHDALCDLSKPSLGMEGPLGFTTEV